MSEAAVRFVYYSEGCPYVHLSSSDDLYRLVISGKGQCFQYR